MSKVSANQPVIASVLDRLIDLEPEQAVDSYQSRVKTVADLCQSVKRDLENLLNTRARPASWDSKLTELNGSLMNYGIPDFLGTQFGSKQAQQELCSKLEKIIRANEPRFKQVSVTLHNQLNNKDRVMHIQIDGLLHLEPMPEPVVFEFALEPDTQNLKLADYYR